MTQLGVDKYKEQAPDFKKVLGNLWWRIYKLGYTYTRFQNIDIDIVRQNTSETGNSRDHYTDHYGRKYSLIAVRELAGYREDLGLIKQWDEATDEDELEEEAEVYYEPRSSLVDIDPSFPQKPFSYNLIKSDFLGDRQVPVEDWVETEEPVEIRPYLVVENLCGESGFWVLLDGFVEQGDPQNKQFIAFFPRGLIVPSIQSTQIVNYLEKQDHSNRWLSDPPEIHYIYAGEIPNCETYRRNGLIKLNSSLEDDVASVSNFSPSDLESDEEEKMVYVLSAEEIVLEADKNLLQNLMPSNTFKALLPVKSGWHGGDYSETTPKTNVDSVCKEISQHLGLLGQPQTFDLFDKYGKRAAISLDYSEEQMNSHHFVFLRKDLLDRYLIETENDFLWLTWGERENRDRAYRVYKRKSFYQVLQYNSLKYE